MRIGIGHGIPVLFLLGLENIIERSLAMKKITTATLFILCTLILLCLSSCEQESDQLPTVPPSDTVGITDAQPTEAPTEPVYSDIYHRLYGEISHGDSYAEVIGLLGSAGTRVKDAVYEWDIDDEKFIRVLFDSDDLSKAKVTKRTIYYVEKKAPSTSTEQDTSADTQPPKEEFTDEEISDIRFAADLFLSEAVDIGDIGWYDISVERYGNERIEVRYTLMIQGYKSHYRHSVYLNSDLSLNGINKILRENLPHCASQLSEGTVAAAKAKIKQDSEKYGGAPSFFTVTNDGYLALGGEIIVYILYPKEADPQSFSDHEHWFFTEKLCKLPDE